MENSMEALALAIRTLKDSNAVTNTTNVPNSPSPVTIPVTVPVGSSNSNSNSPGKSLNNSPEKPSAAVADALFKSELNELKDFFIDVASVKSRVEEKVRLLENPTGVQTKGVSMDKRYAEESNQRIRAMVRKYTVIFVIIMIVVL